MFTTTWYKDITCTKNDNYTFRNVIEHLPKIRYNDYSFSQNYVSEPEIKWDHDHHSSENKRQDNVSENKSQEIKKVTCPICRKINEIKSKQIVHSIEKDCCVCMENK